MGHAREFLVLSVEDDAICTRQIGIAVKSVNRGLAGCSFRIEFAGSADEAEERIADLHPDVCLLDIGLPGGRSGLDVVGFIQANSHAHIAVLSGQSGPEIRAQAWRAGVRGDSFNKREVTELQPQRNAVTHSLQEYLVRMAAVLTDEYEKVSRADRAGGAYRFGSLTFVVGQSYVIDRMGRRRSLGPYQRSVLEFLCAYPRESVTREALVAKLRTPRGNVTNLPLSYAVAGLKGKFGRDIKLKKERVGGYRLISPMTAIKPNALVD